MQEGETIKLLDKKKLTLRARMSTASFKGRLVSFISFSINVKALMPARISLRLEDQRVSTWKGMIREVALSGDNDGGGD